MGKIKPNSSKFLFVKRQNEYDENTTDVYFINIESTTVIIEKNYELFKSILGKEFNTDDLVKNAQSSKSDFWKLFDYPPTQGILFGFGKQNSYLFYWKYQNEIDSSVKQYVDSLSSDFSDNFAEYIYNLSANNFSIPVFRDFSVDNKQVVESYKKDRSDIQEYYKNNDFITTTLELLCN